VVGAKGFEPSTSWSRTRTTKQTNALFGAAYTKPSKIFALSIVPKLYRKPHHRWYHSISV
jgi:hypothetical protein